MISILLPAYKSDELLEKVFLESFWNNTKVDCETIIYDNGGNGNSMPSIKINGKRQEINGMTVNNLSVKVIGDGQNIGLNAALNECAKVAKGDYFYLPHSDMYLMPGWDTALLEACKNLPPASFLLCSRSIEPTQGHTPFQLIKDYGKEWNKFRPDDLLKDFENHKDNSVVTGYRMPFFMHRKLWDKMKGVDDHYFSYCTDDDLFVAAYHAGVRKFWMVNGSLVYHLQGKSNNQQKVDKDSDKPYEYFREKWSKLGYKTNQHIDHFVQSLIPWNLKVK